MKGAIAKAAVAEKLKNCFGDDYIGEYSSKHYVWAMENGERLQIAISMTCPKVQISAEDAVVAAPASKSDSGVNFSDFVPVQITDEERAKVNEMLKNLDNAN